MKNIAELNPHQYPTTPVIDNNLKILFERVMELQNAFDNDLIINSGLRSDEQQMQLIAEKKTNAVHSKHLAGAAADIHDPDGLLSDWISNNLNYMERIGLWMEDFRHTPTWVHVQIMAPLSGKRVFIP